MSRHARRLAFPLVLLTIGIAGFGAPAPAQDPGPGKPAGPTSRPRPGQPVPVTPRMKAIQGLFQAQIQTWATEKRIRLTYFFRNEDEKVFDDFLPKLDPKNKNLRFATPADARLSGLIVAEKGIFLHQARWKTVTVDMTFSTYSGTRKGDYVAAVLHWDRGKRAVACNLGQAMFPMKKWKPSAKPVPAVYPVAYHKDRSQFGFDFRDGKFTCRHREETAVDASDTPIDTTKHAKWLKTVKGPQVGVVWKGRIQGYIDQMVIEGEPDPEWLAEMLPDLPAEDGDGK